VSRQARSSDYRLIKIVDSALADSARRSGEWLACRPGCAQCCVGVFAINQLDASRLRQGLADLEKRDRERAAMVRVRARRSWLRLMPDFPGDAVSGLLSDSEQSKLDFSNFANDEPCPALDPLTQTCDLYGARPLTCRVFGPPVRSEDGLGTCELCFHGATESEIAECEMLVDPDDIESKLVQQVEQDLGVSGHTIVAFSLAS
jgi:Fe-S-cluster containining protein